MNALKRLKNAMDENKRRKLVRYALNTTGSTKAASVSILCAVSDRIPKDMQHDVLSAVLKFLDDADNNVRLYAIEFIRKFSPMPDEFAVKFANSLFNLMERGDWLIRDEAARAFSTFSKAPPVMKDNFVSGMLKWCDDTSKADASVNALGLMGRNIPEKRRGEVVKKLLDMSKSDNWVIRDSVSKALKRLEDTAPPALKKDVEKRIRDIEKENREDDKTRVNIKMKMKLYRRRSH